MKTKNIFRMLLMAVVLLMGANNAKAATINWWIDGQLFESQELAVGTPIVPPTPEAREGYKFTWGWYPETMPDYQVDVNGSYTAIPKHKITYKITVNGDNNNAETYLEEEWYEDAVITPQPAPADRVGFTFDGWGSIPTTMPNYDITVTGNFSYINYSITWTTPDHVNYFSLPQTAHYNDVITPSYNAVDGFAIDQFTVTAEDGTAIEVVDNKFTMPAQNVRVNITFSGAKYTLTWAIDGESEPYLEQELATGDRIDEPETPTKNGYTFNGWGYHPETMPAQNTTVTGSFSAASYTITLTTPQHGNVSLPQTASYNSEVGFYNLQAEQGYELESITVTGEDGTIIPVTADNKFTMPAQNVTVTVTFRANTTVTYSVWNGNGIQNGSVSANPNYQVAPGTTITLSSTPNEGYELDYYSISTDGSTFTPIEGNTFEMPESNVWVIATFKQVGQTKTDVTLSFPQSAYTATMGEAFSAPELTKSEEVSVTYSSSNTGVATVDENGAVTIVAAGQTTITAAFAGDETHNAASAQYTLTVSAAPRTIVLEEGEQVLWNGNPAPTHPGEWNLLLSNTDWLEGTNNTTVLRVYVTIEDQNNWKLYVGQGYWGSVAFSNYNGNITNNTTDAPYNAEGGYFEFQFSADTYNNIKNNNGLAISFYGLTIDEITYKTTEQQTPAKTDVALTFQQATYTATMGEAFTAPQLNKSAEVTVTYSSSNESVATVDASTGAVTLVGAGETTIKAEFAGNDSYNASEASYTLTVTEASQPDVTVYGSFANNVWTFDFNSVAATVSSNTDLTLTDAGKTINGISMATATWDEGTKALNDKLLLGNNNKTWRLVPGTNGGSLYTNNSNCLLGIQNVTAGQLIKVTLTVSEANGTKTYPTANTNVELTTDPSDDGTYVFTVQADGDAGIMLGNKSYISSITIEPAEDTPVQTSYTVTYMVNGETYQEYTVEVGATIPVPENPTGFTMIWGEIPSTMPAENLTIEGTANRNEYTITYMVDGSQYEQQTVGYGLAITPIDGPNKSGYTFTGWQGLPQTMPAENITVTATYTQNGSGGQDETEYVNVTVGTTGYASFCSDKALDVTGLSVYYAESIDDKNVTLKKLTGVVAAGTGLIVKGNSSIPVSNETGTSPTGNLLVGVTSDTEAPAGAYVLVSRNGVATFAQTSEESTATVSAGKAYLYLVAPSGARFLNIVFDDNATGISTLKTNLTGEETIYNLRGQRVTNPTTGLYIVNGKKVFIK